MAAKSAQGYTGIDPVLDLGTALLKNFIYVQVCRSGDFFIAEVTRRQLGPVELSDPHHKRLLQCLQKIYDELDENVELQMMLNDSGLQPTKDVFNKVALEIFSDGNFNWGRVVALFYFACRLVTKANSTKKPEIIRTIIIWTMSFIQEHVINWIREQGGWEGILPKSRAPKWQITGLLLAGVLATLLVICKT